MKNFLKSKLKIFVTATCIILLLSACQTIRITNNSFLDSSMPNGFPQNSTFFIVFTDTENQIISNDIQNLISTEVTQKLTNLLKHRGYKVAASYENADYILVFSFGMTSFKSIVNVPIYIPGQIQTTTGNVYGYGGSAQYQQQTVNSGSYTFIPQEQISFTRTFVAQIYDAKLYKEKKIEKRLWYGCAASVGESGDMRDIVDYLIVSTFKYFGKDTVKFVDNNLSYNNKDVKDLRNNYPIKLKNLKKNK